MKNIIISIHPEYSMAILNGSKTVELRKKFPDFIMPDAVLYLYSTLPVQAITGKVTIDRVNKLPVNEIRSKFIHRTQVDADKFNRYFNNAKLGYAIELKDHHRFKNRIPLSYMEENGGFSPPQSFMYADAKMQKLIDEYND